MYFKDEQRPKAKVSVYIWRSAFDLNKLLCKQEEQKNKNHTVL